LRTSVGVPRAAGDFPLPFIFADRPQLFLLDAMTGAVPDWTT
jgi:hypothetical protein